tara:strand:- start:466 stop:1248 length:783 start_codon:yes stop_codon:yes gene_type:complete
MKKNTKISKKMTLIDHLIELRNRLLVAAISFLILFFLCFIKFTDNNQNLADLVYIFLQQPLANELAKTGGRMIFTALHEGFFTQVKVAFFISFSIAFPIFLIQIWKFVAPGLYENEKKAFFPFLIATPILFLLGAAMVYYIVIPLAWNFFISFQVTSFEGALPIELEPKISEYLSLVMKLIFAFGLCFELPVVLLLLTRTGIITSQDLAEKRKYAILTAFVLAAILTPPDVISQILLAVPIIVLYEFTIILSKIGFKKTN